jgi:hypothetical protein
VKLSALVLACAFAVGCGGGADASRGFSVPWRLEAVSLDGRELTLRYERGVCDRFDHVLATERATAVTLTVFAIRDQPDQACAAGVVVGSAKVRLVAPLGSRKLLRGPVRAIRP